MSPVTHSTRPGAAASITADPPVPRVETSSDLALEDSLERVVGWVRTNGYRGYEPADGNASFLFPLTFGRQLPMRLLQQLVLRAPVNIRPLVGVRPHESPIGRGYMAWAYSLLGALGASDWTREEAAICLDWLLKNRAAGYDEFCWGDPYDYATRSGRRPYGEPLLIWTSLIGLAFLQAYDVWHDIQHLHVARSIGRWIQKLPREETETGCCLSYVAYKQSSIHNANVMGAAFLARLASYDGNRDLGELATRALSYTCTRQRGDGGWFYAEEPRYHWIDGFHTGYNLSALKVYRASTGDTAFDRQRMRGTDFFLAHLFEPDGRPRYFHNRTYPLDIQCAAQAIDTCAELSDERPECLGHALRVATWTLAHMQAADGHFLYRDLGWMKVATPMLHWGQASMAKAIVSLLRALRRAQKEGGGA